jgi:hypothetical protein
MVMLLGDRLQMNVGDLKSLLPLWESLATNQRYRLYVDERDIFTFRNRAENEGLHFLTIALPRIGKALDEFHATNIWNPPIDFSVDEDQIPHFLGIGIMLALAGDSSAVDCVRQLSYLFYKLEVDYDKAVVEDFIQSFVTTDRDLLATTDYECKDTFNHVAIMARIIKRIVCNTDPLDIRPCHGSGATACRTANEDKWHKLRYFPSLDCVYPYADYFFYSFTHLADEFEKLESSAESVPCARVVLVPKDSRGPRIISCEPAELMFIQQGIMRSMYAMLESHPLTKSQINFRDQSINRNLARESSIHGYWATLDLSEASDRVSLCLVEQVFPENWVECLKACRSESTILPSGQVVKLNKFAPMGSSCCFPVEALVFWASVQATFRRIGIKSKAYVYGDDIIIPSGFSEEVMHDLELIGLKINVNKSFFRGPFRESCGGDYHRGVDVTPVRLRKGLASSRTAIATDADFCNLLIAKFGYDAVVPIIDFVEEKNDYVFPRTELSIPCTIRCSPRASNDVWFKVRWNKYLQRTEHRVLGVVTGTLVYREKAWSELLRKELTSERHSNRNPSSATWVKPQISTEPGQYAVTHSAIAKWAWTWLG